MTIDVKAIIAKHRGLTEAKEVSHSHALNKIKNGEWESVNDLTPGRHNEFIDHTKNHKPRFTAYVKVAPSPRPPLAEQTLDEAKFAVGDRVFTDEHKHGTVKEVCQGDKHRGHTELYAVLHDGEKHPRVFRHHDLQKSLVKEGVEELDEKADMEHHDPAHHLMKYRGHMAIADAYYDMGDKDSAEAHMAKADRHARKHFHITGTHPERE